ncbi:predicted protein [Histoplasma capsulatum G186AR]|uniref:Uncharacterized protein n=1 Tax=Ajellomyces capsulatus (strain G186AR / H82 / ATCC MYA-2454 / RMSCC 2432) TaxID=447093 RepID=C0NEC1_AJECG|nr:uncharacterized protein HCBG_01237 [Histoplasma capsulatum G186AR]EEH09592.1 predicted protein [Histoplasma capsulatum G186AR]
MDSGGYKSKLYWRQAARIRKADLVAKHHSISSVFLREVFTRNCVNPAAAIIPGGYQAQSMPNPRVKMCLCQHAIPADGFRDLHLGAIYQDKVELFRPEPGINEVSRFSSNLERLVYFVIVVCSHFPEAVNAGTISSSCEILTRMSYSQ